MQHAYQHARGSLSLTFGLWDNRLKMEQGVKPFAHNEALAPLNGHLVSGKRSQENEEADNVADSPVRPDLGETGSHNVCEVVVSDVENVYCGGTNCCDGGSKKNALTVVHAVDYSLILLPFVGLHFFLFF